MRIGPRQRLGQPSETLDNEVYLDQRSLTIRLSRLPVDGTVTAMWSVRVTITCTIRHYANLIYFSGLPDDVSRQNTSKLQ